MIDKWRFLRNRIRERLWVKPLGFCVISVGMSLLASLADGSHIGGCVFDVSTESVATLLQIMSASMLVVATFAVGSMVAAYAAASSTATPRSFPLIIADDVSQNALSTFIGAFIFSIVALVAVKNSFYQEAGRFVLFTLTLAVLALVIVTFVRWVDSIARLGRLGSTVKKVEAAAGRALQRRRTSPTLGGIPAQKPSPDDTAVESQVIGYVQRCDMGALQAFAEKAQLRITVAALPGTFAVPGRALAFVAAQGGIDADLNLEPIRAAFAIGSDRTFDEDPRFGLVVLSEIACRALSPAVNDPGTAIDVIGSLVRLFAAWAEPPREGEVTQPEFGLVAVPELSLDDLLEDAFRGIARDGAGTIEVAVWLQKGLRALTMLGNRPLSEAAERHAGMARARAEAALDAPADLALLRSTAGFAGDRA